MEQEWRLLLGSAEETDHELVTSVINGNFLHVLTSSSSRALLAPFARQVGLSADRKTNSPLSFTNISLADHQSNNVSALDRLCVAVAALHSFIQANWTGPDLDESLLKTGRLLRNILPDAFPSRTVNLTNEDPDDEEILLDDKLRAASLDALTLAGEPAYHLCQAPLLLVLALRILDTLHDSALSSAPFWRLRSFSIHSRILDTPQAPPSPLLASLVPAKEYLQQKTDAVIVDDDEAKRLWGKVLARVLVDEALALQRAGRDKDASEVLLEAARANGLQYTITGAPGKRTKFQREDKMILVLLAKSADTSLQASEEVKDPEEREEEDDEVSTRLPSEQDPSNSGWKATPAVEKSNGMPSEYLHNDDTLLERTRFTSTDAVEGEQTSTSSLSQADATNPTVLDPLDSCILLGLCLNIHNTSPENGLTASEMSAFVNRVLAHPRNWSVHTMALLLRSRLEADRTRTAQRSALQLQALIDQMPTSDSDVNERLRLVHELELPSKWDMQAELARRYAALGVLRSALEIFERIEQWQEVVQCWGALGRQDKGIEVVRDLLQGRKAEAEHVLWEKKDRSESAGRQLSVARQAKLWCLLGDLEVSNAEEHYNEAWNVSGRRSARAARSIGGVAFANADYPKATLWLRRALRIQPLFARSWFILGCVYMRFDTSKGFIEAARCFRRCTALEDEDVESWNNLASCYLRLAQQSEAVLREAQLAEEGEAQSDQRAVLQDVHLDDDNDDGQSDVGSEHSRDSGVAVQSDMDADGGDTETEMDVEEDGAGRRAERERQRQTMVLPAISGSGGGRGSGQGAFDVKLLAHRALAKALRFSHDDWRVWNNFMIVSVDCGLMNDAVRALTRVVQLRSNVRTAPSTIDDAKNDLANNIVDVGVLNRIVDAVTRAPSSEEDAVVAQEDGQTTLGATASSQAAHVQHNPHEGHGLWPAVRTLFVETLLTRISSSAAIWRAYARLLFWRGRFRSALDAHLSAWQSSYGAEGSQVTTDKKEWLEAVEALQELCELMENFGPREVIIAHDDGEQELDVDEAKRASAQGQTTNVELAMHNWRFRARSLVRTFIGRTRDAFDQEPEWQTLIDLRDSLSSSSTS